ncbi:MAG: transposase, partial [Alphaproteobacteria bacterium]|nr:transposase [Alphaproteobacteria bacterium]
MARMARLVVPGHPHHVTQRGVRRMKTFLRDADYETYLALLTTWCGEAGTKIWAWCLMPNHVHLILVPRHEDGLRAALAQTHRRYTRKINAREGWQGHLWQERFHSFPMDEAHLLAAVRYVELNPVRAGLVKRPEQWRWSSAKAHRQGREDGVTALAPMLRRVPDWKGFLGQGLDEATLEDLRRHSRTGHPLGGKRFFTKLEKLFGQ